MERFRAPHSILELSAGQRLLDAKYSGFQLRNALRQLARIDAPGPLARRNWRCLTRNASDALPGFGKGFVLQLAAAGIEYGGMNKMKFMRHKSRGGHQDFNTILDAASEVN